MKGNEKIIERLNALLADELTAINQYIVHSEMCANWQYHRLHQSIEKRAITEMKHAETLIARVLFLEGKPIVSVLNKITVGAEVEAQLKNDLAAELGARCRRTTMPSNLPPKPVITAPAKCLKQFSRTKRIT
jgi:bacterioferritin